MDTVKVGIREFRAGLAEYIASDTAVAVTRHGQTVGYFIPTLGQADADLASLKKAAAGLTGCLQPSRLMSTTWLRSSRSLASPLRRAGTSSGREKIA